MADERDRAGKRKSGHKKEWVRERDSERAKGRWGMERDNGKGE